MDLPLRHRAEQALLGALLAGGDPAVVGDVRAGDFIDPEHQAIYAAITGQYRGGELASGLQVRLARLGRLHLARAVAYAGALPQLCPQPDHLPAYGAMVMQDQRRAGAPQPGSRDSGGPDGQLAGADSWLSSATDWRSAAAGGWAPEPGTRRLARAMAPVVRRLREQGATQPAEGRTGGGSVLPDGDGSGALRGGDLQELVLADLIRHPGAGTRGLAGRVPPAVFGARERQELFVVIRGILAQGRPLDPLIAAWEARQWEAWRGSPREGESLAALALRLGEMPTIPGTAGLLTRGLLADYELTRAFGPGWMRQRDLIGGSGPKAGSGGQVRRAARVTPGAARSGQAPAWPPAPGRPQPGLPRPKPGAGPGPVQA